MCRVQKCPCANTATPCFHTFTEPGPCLHRAGTMRHPHFPPPPPPGPSLSNFGSSALVRGTGTERLPRPFSCSHLRNPVFFHIKPVLHLDVHGTFGTTNGTLTVPHLSPQGTSLCRALRQHAACGRSWLHSPARKESETEMGIEA